MQVNLLKTILMIFIPASDTPVRNRIIVNIIYDMENALRTANVRVVTYDTNITGRLPNLVRERRSRVSTFPSKYVNILLALYI